MPTKEIRIYLNRTQVFRDNFMSYFSPQPNVQMRENPFHTLTLNTVALLLVGVDHMLPVVKNISQMIKRTRISSTIIVIQDIIDCSNYSIRRCKIYSWSSTEKYVGKIHFCVFCLSYLVQPVGNVRYSPGLELNQRWKPICLVHLLHFTSIFPIVLQIYVQI